MYGNSGYHQGKRLQTIANVGAEHVTCSQCSLEIVYLSPIYHIGRYEDRGLMEQFDNFGNSLVIAALVICVLLLPFFLWALFKLVFWAKGAPKGAYLFLAIFPLISLFPIPPPQFKNIEKAKQEQLKRKEDAGDPPDE